MPLLGKEAFYLCRLYVTGGYVFPSWILFFFVPHPNLKGRLPVWCVVFHQNCRHRRRRRHMERRRCSESCSRYTLKPQIVSLPEKPCVFQSSVIVAILSNCDWGLGKKACVFVSLCCYSTLLLPSRDNYPRCRFKKDGDYEKDEKISKSGHCPCSPILFSL